MREGYWVLSDAITEADTNTVKTVIEIPAKTFVETVKLIVTEVFAGGTPSIDIGDSDDADIWVDTTDVTETSVGTYCGDGSDAAFYLGHYYATANKLKATISASLSDGTAYVLAKFIRLNDDL